MKTPRRCLAFVVLLCGSATLSSAQNLLQNGTFDEGIAPWTVPNSVNSFATATFSPLDSRGDAASGSIRVTTTTPGEQVGGGVVSECFPVFPGLTYRKLYEYRLDPGQTTGASVNAQLSFFSDTTCSVAGSLVGHGGLVETEADGGWHSNRDASDRYTAPSAARGARLRLHVGKEAAGGSASAQFDHVAIEALDPCELDNVLCLNNGRFHVSATWRTADSSGRARVVQLTEDTGYLWFFDPSNVEVVVKVLDACSTFDRYWVFAGGLTDVEVEMIVIDSLTGETNTYRNELGEPFAPLQDTDAFRTCP